MASLDFAAFLKNPKATAGAFARRYHVSVWLVVASVFLTALIMRESEVTVIILGANVLLLWMAVGLFKDSAAGFWLVILSEILSATQMRPNRAAVLALIFNLALLLFALLFAKFAAAREDANS
jgi:hypothetical protein